MKEENVEETVERNSTLSITARSFLVTERELKEIRHALFYDKNLAHGTVGHNVLMLLAKFAKDMGFRLNGSSELALPAVRPVEIVKENR